MKKTLRKLSPQPGKRVQQVKRAVNRGKYITAKGYRGGRNLWRSGFGYGYGAYLAYRYKWVATAFPYDEWFPQGDWVPYYTVAPQYVEQYDDAGAAIPDNAYQVNPDFGAAALPSLPSFAELGIDLTPLANTSDSLTEDQQRIVSNLRRRITNELKRLQTQYAADLQKGYFIVPDLDRSRFSWVKRV